MAFLAGLNDYLLKQYRYSTFEEALSSGACYCLHLHGQRILQGSITENSPYGVVVTSREGERTELHKTQIKMLYPAEQADGVNARMTIDEAVRSRAQDPIVPAKPRHHIKNKTLFPLMRAGMPLVVTLLEGEVLEGVIQSFARYELTLALGDHVQVVVLRHAIFDVRNSEGRCFLKSSQQTLRDWTASELYIDLRPRSQLRPGLKKVKIKRRKKVIIR